MIILGIETSCDETAAAVVEDGTTVLSNVVASQVDIHARYGGVVPEVASRQHVLTIIPVVTQSLMQAGVTWSDIEGVAVTMGPGLAGSLLIGVNTAKALAFSRSLPFLGINHLEGHIYAGWLTQINPESNPGFPLLCLVASGGHTDLILMEGHGRFTLLGRTRDDAAGEAFDKAARLLGLGYPGGPAIQRAAEGVVSKQRLPRAWMRGTLDFSFSGVKTALLHRAEEHGLYPSPAQGPFQEKLIQEMAAAFQESLVDVLVTKTLAAAEQYRVKGVLLGGGVIANLRLRERIIKDSSLPVIVPPVNLCTDNAAMIASCSTFHFIKGERHTFDLDVLPSLQLG